MAEEKKEICPVCKTSCDTKFCTVCGFGQRCEVFMSEDDGNYWYANVVYPHARKWAESLNAEYANANAMLLQVREELKKVKSTNELLNNQLNSRNEAPPVLAAPVAPAPPVSVAPVAPPPPPSSSKEVPQIRNLLFTPRTGPVNIIGNTTGNISNKGFIAIQGDYLYYSNINGLGDLYKVRTDGTEKQKLCDDCCEFINVRGSWVYYSNLSDGEKLYRISIDGDQKEKLNDDRCDNIIVTDDWVYYINLSSNNNVYRSRTDGNDKQVISDMQVTDISIEGGSIYSASGGSVYKNNITAHSGAMSPACIYKGSSVYAYANNINVHANIVYVLDINGGLYRGLRIDGKGDLVRIYRGCILSYNIVGNYIFFIDDDDRLYRMDLAGSDIRKLNDEPCEYINIAVDWVYSISNGKFIKMRMDGGEKQPAFL